MAADGPSQPELLAQAELRLCSGHGVFDSAKIPSLWSGHTRTRRLVSIHRMNRRVQIIAGCVVFAAVLVIIVRTKNSGTSAPVPSQRQQPTGNPIVLAAPTSGALNWKVVVTLPKTATNSPSTNPPAKSQ